MIYADANYYSNVYGGKNNLSDFKRASREVDNLTFNRIVAKGFENLTDFQKEIIKDAVCRIADFEYENDGIAAGISGYSINGVSVTFGGNGVITQNGITIPAAVYEDLKQTGLGWRGV